MHTLHDPEPFSIPINLNATDSNEVDPFVEELNVERINQRFRQESPLKGVVREFTIFNDRYLHQLVKRKHRRTHEFHISLELLDATPRRDYLLAYDWLTTALLSALATLLMLYISWFSPLQMRLTSAYLITAFTVSFFLITLLTTILKTENRILLHSRYGRVPIVELMNNNPDRESLTRFVAQLSQQIEQSQQGSSLEPKEQLSLELKELRRLHNESLISLQAYEEAKQRIFANQAFKSGG